jgi:hypothetical protein
VVSGGRLPLPGDVVEKLATPRTVATSGFSTNRRVEPWWTRSGFDFGKYFRVRCRFGVRERVKHESRRSPAVNGEKKMKYFVLLAGYGELKTWDELTPEEQEANMAEHAAFDAACAARPEVELLGGEALGDGTTATTLRTRGGESTITDGPFAEVAEHIGGYYLIEAPELDTVIDLCKVLPGYDIEIRPVLDFS